MSILGLLAALGLVGGACSPGGALKPEHIHTV